MNGMRLLGPAKPIRIRIRRIQHLMYSVWIVKWFIQPVDHELLVSLLLMVLGGKYSTEKAVKGIEVVAPPQ